MLRRSTAKRLWELRSYFTAKGGRAKETEVRMPRPFDVDAIVEAAQKSDQIQIHGKGHITQGMIKSEEESVREGNRRRKKVRMGPREKYMFRKILQRRRFSANDPASDLEPLYEMVRPWMGFSRVKKSSKTSYAATRTYTPEETHAILAIRKAIEQPSAFVREVPDVISPARLNVTSKYFQTAENAEQEGEKNRERLARRLAERLHREEVQSKQGIQTTVDPQPEGNVVLDKALSQDPTFQEDAAQLEAASKDMEDIDQWIEHLKEFAVQHEAVLDAMSPQERQTPHLAGESEPVGDMAAVLKDNMAGSGVNVEKLEEEARKELLKERSR